MRTLLTVFLNLVFVFISCEGYKILAIFPYDGRSHHIYYSSLVEELSTRGHEVTVINYFPLKNKRNLRQIILHNDTSGDNVNMEEYLKSKSNFLREFSQNYKSAKIFKYLANTNCERLINNKEVRGIVQSGEHFDLVIAEQFITDCGLAVAYHLKAVVVGTTAHVPMSWIYSRLGAPNNPAFVPSHYLNTGHRPNFWQRFRTAYINTFYNLYYEHFIQKEDQEIVRKVYPDTPDLESLGRNISLFLLNQYFPLTGSRIYGANVIEVGGLHIKPVKQSLDKEIESFLNSTENGVVYVSFGSVAKNFPKNILDEIKKAIQKSNMKFIWKLDENVDVPNVLVRKWFSQQAILCHPKIKAFITHSGMLSSSEAMHCGVPIIGLPLFGDQFANAESAIQCGLGVALDIETLDEKVLTKALDTVTQDRYQKRAKELSKLWRDRPMSPMDTAIFWIEYVARHKHKVDLRPPTVDLPLYQYLMLDVIAIFGLVILLIVFVFLKLMKRVLSLFETKDLRKTKKKKT